MSVFLFELWHYSNFYTIRLKDYILGFYENDFIFLSEDTQSDVIEAFHSTSPYLDDPLKIDNNFFDSMGNRVYPSELQ